MDPSADACIIYDSFKQDRPIIHKISPSEWYQQENNIKLTPGYTHVNINVGQPAIYCDINKYQVLQQVKDAFNTEGFIEARDETNPFEYIGRSIFINRAAIKLANIDAVNHVTNTIFTFDNKQSDKSLTFCDIAAGPGGFTQYMQYRFPNSKGFGITLKHDKLDWSTKFIDMTRFNPFYGPDNTGNLYTNWEYFIKYIKDQQPNGVDLVTGDGGFDLEEGVDKTLLHHQEFLSSRLLLAQSLVGIGCTKIGGNFIVKSFDTVTNISAQIIFILAQCFNKILIFKPVSSRPANAEKYILCIDRKPEIQDYYDLLANAAVSYTDNMFLSQLFIEKLPSAFEQWLISYNNHSTNKQLQAAQNILLYLQGNTPQIQQYDIHKFLLIWNLPDTPLNIKRSKINIS